MLNQTCKVFPMLDEELKMVPGIISYSYSYSYFFGTLHRNSCNQISSNLNSQQIKNSLADYSNAILSSHYCPFRVHWIEYQCSSSDGLFKRCRWRHIRKWPYNHSKTPLFAPLGAVTDNTLCLFLELSSKRHLLKKSSDKKVDHVLVSPQN